MPRAASRPREPRSLYSGFGAAYGSGSGLCRQAGPERGKRETVHNTENTFRCFASALLVAAVAASGVRAQAIAEPAVQGAGSLVVLNGTSSEVLLLDPASNRILARFPTGPDPREVALSPDGRFAYVTSYAWEPDARPVPASMSVGAPDGEANAAALASAGSRGVTVLDLARRRVHAVFRPGTYRGLGGIAVGADGKRLWMTSEAEEGVVELDALTGEVKMLWKTGSSGATSVAVSRNGRRVYVSNRHGDQITVIDRVTVVASGIATGRGPTGLALTPDGSELWVLNSGDGTVSVINTRRQREVARFPSGGREPAHVSFHPTRGEAWVAHGASRTVTVIERASGAVLARIEVPGEPRSVTFSSDGRRAWVSSPDGQRVFSVDVRTYRLTGDLAAGSRPGGIAWSRFGAP